LRPLPYPNPDSPARRPSGFAFISEFLRHPFSKHGLRTSLSLSQRRLHHDRAR
jgi:hypothetical protein